MYWGRRAELVLVTAPTIEPITVQDAKAHSRIRITQDDVLIQNVIRAVREMVEKENDLALITQTWRLKLDRFAPEMIIYKWPVQSISSVKYLNAAGSLATVDTSIWESDLLIKPPRVITKPNQSWPDLTDVRPGAVEIEFIAGYGNTPESVPEHVRQYMMARIGDAYEYRESFIPNNVQVNPFIERLIATERLNSF